ncbi:MAG: hypothetical protein ACRECJ_03895 [Limisphaerales bacterium]
MKKLKQSIELNRYMGAVKLYRDDLDEIFDTLRELSDKITLDIIIGQFQLSSVEELSEVKQNETENFSVKCLINGDYFPSLSIRVTKNNAHLSCDKDTPISRGVFAKLERMLMSRRRKWHWVNSSIYSACFLAILGSYLSLQGKVDKWAFLNTLGGVFSGIGISIFLLYALTFPARRSKIILVERVMEQSFWKRNKDKVAVALITALITAVLSILGTLLVQSISE